jgi:hypothetical protein
LALFVSWLLLPRFFCAITKPKKKVKKKSPKNLERWRTLLRFSLDSLASHGKAKKMSKPRENPDLFQFVCSGSLH